MGRNKDAAYQQMISRQYGQLMERCREHMAKMDTELPPARQDFSEQLKDYGVSRRDFLKWSSAVTTALMLPPIFKPMVAKAAENFSRVPVVWLHFAECTGCSESFLRTSYPGVADLLLDTLSLEYHETIMAAAGYQAEQNLEKALHDFDGQFICVIEGGLPTGMDGKYLTLGPQGKTGLEIAKEVTSRAAATICIGTCSAFGGVQAANPNPTDAKSISEALGIQTVNISGCPPNPANFVGTILHYLLFGGLPALDALERPVWAYGKRIHDFCERRPHYDAGEFVEEWGDEYAKNGWCLYKMGCKGPYTYANCSKIKFNDGISWPVQAGHGCIGCTEPAFWDTMAPFEKPISEKTVGGGERTIDKIGVGLLGVTAAGIAAHGVVSALKRHKPEE